MPSIYIAIKNQSEADNFSNDGRALILHVDAISAIGKEVGLKRLDEYVFTPLDEISEIIYTI